MGEDNVLLFKEIYEHLLVQYNLLEGANEKLSQKATNLLGFAGVVFGILVSFFFEHLPKIKSLDIYLPFVAICIIVLLFFSIICFFVATRIYDSCIFITPSFLVEKMKEGVPREKLWEKFSKSVQKAYDENKKENRYKSRWIIWGIFLFLLSFALLVGIITANIILP